MSISLILNTSRHSTCRRSLATLHSAGFHSRSHHTSFGCASWLGQPRRATDIPILKGTSIPSTYRLASSKISSIPISRSLYGSTVSFSSSASSKAHSSGSSGSGSRGSHKTESQGSWKVRTAVALGLVGAGVVAYHNVQDFRYIVLAGVRCSRVAEAALKSAADYKWTFFQSYTTEEEEAAAVSRCHERSAQRVLAALLANGGIFIKLGQHISSLAVLPVEWTRTMRPLQDKCEPTPYGDVDAMFRKDMGASIEELFVEFDAAPIGVASLAQVHRAVDRRSGREVAVKVQHPHLVEFCEVDMRIVEVAMGWIKALFPEFEFNWLAGEMRENLPKEMDFTLEATNAQRAIRNFEHTPHTSLYIPRVLGAQPRVLVMEFIRGGRVDDLAYLANHDIDRNMVSLELARVFGKMVHLDGFFHADPHAGNLLIRPKNQAPGSRSPYNFEVVLLDHGLYFDLDDELRVNYSRFWLSLLAPASEKVNADRRKYAQLVGNIGPDLYPVFEAALTGRANLEGSTDDPVGANETWGNAKSLLDAAPPSAEEQTAIRNAVIERDGLLLSIFDVLRRVPKRVLMVFKLNDLTRSLDHALATTHSSVRVFLVTARYCALAVWRDDRTRLVRQIRERGYITFGHIGEWISCWWRFEKMYRGIGMAEAYMDTVGTLVRLEAWFYGLRTHGWHGAKAAAAGLM